MGFYDKYILPTFLDVACGVEPIAKQRQKVVPHAFGTVLEIGIGSGLNLPHYSGDKVDRVIGVEPAEEIWAKAGKRVDAVPFDVDFVGLKGEEIDIEDKVADSVVITYTMCTIPDVLTALEQVRRVMKPGAPLFFSEHGKAPDEAVRKWQDRLNPLWNKMAGGCNLNRDIPKILADGGFKVDDLDSMYVPGPKFATFTYWGTASAR